METWIRMGIRDHGLFWSRERLMHPTAISPAGRDLNRNHSYRLNVIRRNQMALLRLQHVSSREPERSRGALLIET